MASVSTSSIVPYHGLWTNYGFQGADDPAKFITVTQFWGSSWKIFIGVWLGLSWSCIKAILIRSWAWLQYFNYEMRHQKHSPFSHEQVSLLSPNGSASSDLIPSEDDGDLGAGQLARVYSPTDSGFGTNTNTNETHIPNQRDQRVHGAPSKTRMYLPEKPWADLVVLGIAILYAVASGLISEIPASTSGLLENNTCGFWDLKRNADQRIRDNDDLIQAKKEARAGQYGRNCYGEQAITNPDQCNFFESRKIDYDVERIDCPFECPNPDRCICANGIYRSAVRLTTPAFTADNIGLNSKNLPLVKRASTYVPLDINTGFVVDVSEDDDHLQFEYHLGAVNASGAYRNHTFTMYGLPFDWDIPAYSVSAYESTPSGSKHDAWRPIPQLSRPINTYMTAVFISPCRIIYSGRCEDPVFPATSEWFQDGRPLHKFYNEDPRARVLIAIDEMEVCPHETSKCYPPHEIYPEFGVEYEFVRNALRRTSTFRSIEYRLGSALVASESISDYESRQLDNEQWIIESKALFNTSLARLQFNTLDIAIGDRPTGDAAAGYEDAYEDTTPTWARGKLCGKYRFHLPSEYTNLRVTISVVSFLVPVVLYILSREHSLMEEFRQPRLEGYWMPFDTCIWVLCSISWWAVDNIRSWLQRRQARRQ